MKRTPLAILISGRGSNMAALLEAARDPCWPGEPVLVLSNRPGAGGLDTAAQAGIATAVVDHAQFGGNREVFERAMDEELNRHGSVFVALAGFMRVLTPWFVARWQGRLVNIHPSLLPAYRGRDTHARALAAGETVHGCSVHHVSDGVDEGRIIDGWAGKPHLAGGIDEGRIIAQARVPVAPGDTEDSLAARVLEAEHALYPDALAKAIRDWQADEDRLRQLGRARS